MVCIFTFFSCNLIPQVAVLTIINASGKDVKNIKITYEHASKEQLQTVKIDNLSDNQSKTLNLELTSPSSKIGAGVAVVQGEIEYYIDTAKFDMDNGDGDIELADSEFKTIIIIHENGWSVKREK